MSSSQQEDELYDIGEFASFHFRKIEDRSEFEIVLRGPLKFANLLRHKVGNLQVSQSELDYWQEPNDN